MSVKNKILSLTASLLLLTMLTLPAGAVSLDVTDPDAMLPVDIILDQDNKEIRKVYDLSPNTDPSTLPMGQFERDGLLYECSDVLREVIIGSETQVITQEEKVDSDKKDMDTILSLLPQEKEVTTEEGFTGTLTLDLDSIKTEAAGYGSSTQPVTATRTYPNLANQDLNHLPKSITEGGRTLTLQDVQWQTDNTYNADDYEIGDRFTAVCTYGGSKTVSYVTGYTTTANYTGEVYRTGVTVIRYTVIFTGTPVEPMDGGQSQSGGLNWLIVALPALAALGAGTGGMYFIMKRKERKMYEELAESNDADGNEEFDEEVLHMRQLLKTKLVDMDLSVRALNCLKAADVETLGDLVQFNKTDLLKFRNFGKKSLTELDDLLESLNLSFGTDISKYKLDKE